MNFSEKKRVKLKNSSGLAGSEKLLRTYWEGILCRTSTAIL